MGIIPVIFVVAALPFAQVLRIAHARAERAVYFALLAALLYGAVWQIGLAAWDDPASSSVLSRTPLAPVAIAVSVPPAVLAVAAPVLVPGLRRTPANMVLLLLSASVAGPALSLPLAFGGWLSILASLSGLYAFAAATHVTVRALGLASAPGDARLRRWLLMADAFLLAAALLRFDEGDSGSFLAVSPPIHALTGYWPEVPAFILPAVLMLAGTVLMWFRCGQIIRGKGRAV